MAWTAAGVQSGTDTSLAGITAVTGVTVNVTALGVKVYNVPASVAVLTINGTLSWNPDLECLVCSDGTRVEQNAGSIVTIGAETTVNGKVRFSRGTGLIMNRQQASAPSNTNATNWWVKNGASITLNGGQVKTAGGFFFGSNAVIGQTASLTINGRAEIMNIHNSLIMQVIRSFSSANLININSAVFSGLGFASIPFSSAGFGTLSVESDFNSFQADGNGQRDPVTVLNPVFVDNKADRDFTYVAFNNSTNNVNKYLFRNSDVGSALRTAGQSGSTWRIGAIELSKDVQFAVTDADGNPAADVVSYMKLNGASLNPVGRFAGVDDYVTPRVYVASTSGAGTTDPLDVLYAVAQGYATDNTDAGQPLTMDSLTSRAGDVHVANVGGYSYISAQVAVTMRGVNTNTVDWTVFDDVSVTLSRADALALLGSKITVDPATQTVTVLDDVTYDDLYDATKAYKYNGQQTNFETPTANALIITPNGTQLTGFNGWTLVVNNGVTLDEGDKFKFVQFTNITNNGLITGVYGSDAGVSKILEVAGVTAGASVYVGNDSTGITTLFVDDADQESYRVYFEPGATPAQLVARELYGFQRFEQVVTLQDGLNVISLVDIEDVGIDEPDLATVLAYTDINTGSKFYDRTAAFRLTEQGIKKGQIATRSGFAIELDEGVGVLVNQNATLIYSLASGLITIKALSFEADTRYNTIIAVPPATVEADTNEVISIAVEDANGDSSVDILGGDGTFELYKVTEATPTADFAQGELLDTVSNGRYRFISAPGFDIVGVDINSNIRRRSSMSKGIYEQAFFVGEQIQLAQAPQVLENSVKLDILAVELASIKGVGYDTNKQSLVKLRQHVTNASQF